MTGRADAPEYQEFDTTEFCDPRVLETDARIYVAGLVRLLNRIRCSARGAHLQDWGDVGTFVPGLSEAARVLGARGKNPRKEVVVLNYAFAQRNRLGLLTRELAELAERP